MGGEVSFGRLNKPVKSRKLGLQRFIGGPGQASNIQNTQGPEVREANKGQIKGNMGSKGLMRDFKDGADDSLFLIENVIAQVHYLGLVSPA
jgi:hypothetical protein